MGCNNFDNDRTTELVEASMRGENSYLDPEIAERVMPQVEEALIERFDQMMEEKNAELVEKAEEIIDNGESTFPDMTPEEKELMNIAAQAAEQEIKTLRPVETAPAERQAIREVGEELGLSPARYVGTADIVRFPRESIKEVVTLLNHPEMPRSFTKRESIGQVQYADRPDISALTGIVGVTQTTNPETTGEEKTLGIFILPDADGKTPTGKPLAERIFHEVIHGNWPKISWYIREHKPEFDQVMAKQLETRGLPSGYTYKTLIETTEKILEAERQGLPPPKEAEQRLLREAVAEFGKHYFTGRSQLLPETQRLFKDMLGYFQ